MAYRVSRLREGFYVYMDVRSSHGEVVKELERRLKVSDAVIKYMTMRVDEELKRQEKLKQHRERRAARRPRKTVPAAAPAAPAAASRAPQHFNQLSSVFMGEIKWQTNTQYSSITAGSAVVFGTSRQAPADREARVPREVPGRREVPRSAASGILCARRKCAASASIKSTTSTTRRPKFWPFIQERGKILPRRMTGTCARHQRWLTVAIKRAQNIALLPFAAEL